MQRIKQWETLAVTEATDRVVVQLNRPAVRNAIDQKMISELHEICVGLEQDPKILIMTGYRDGDRAVFASGADIKQLKARTAIDALNGINSTLFNRIASLPMPVIAALDGYALGGGAELALAADFRLGTADLRFGQPETSLGIIAAAGGLWRLKEIIGIAAAKQMLLAGFVVNGSQALELGLVSSLHEPDALMVAAHELADRIARQDPLAVRLSKQVLSMPASAHPAVDDITQAILFESTEKHRRMQAFLDKKSANSSIKAKASDD